MKERMMILTLVTILFMFPFFSVASTWNVTYDLSTRQIYLANTPIVTTLITRVPTRDPQINSRTGTALVVLSNGSQEELNILRVPYNFRLSQPTQTATYAPESRATQGVRTPMPTYTRTR